MKIDWQKEKKKNPLCSFYKKFIWMQLLLIGKKKKLLSTLTWKEKMLLQWNGSYLSWHSLFLKLASKLLTIIYPHTYAICSVSAGELEDQSVVWLFLGSPEVTLHRSSQIKAASCLIHLLEYIASPRLSPEIIDTQQFQKIDFLKYSGIPSGCFAVEKEHLCFPNVWFSICVWNT